MAEQAEAHVRELSGHAAAAFADAEPALRRMASRWCGSSDEAQDLIQDTFERALRHGISSEIRSVGAWLATIMHNLFVNRCRAAARMPDHEVLEDTHVRATATLDAPEPAWSRITVQDIQDALELIEPVYRDVYRLHTFDHLSYEQIANQLSIQRITVGTRLSRARRRLREVLLQRFDREGEP
jgi:RNA polymerase sigma-70 factor, ECF subfamily